ncbi:hypothetical protein [Leptospira weilii]|nr:hypothetical protein [Leptospira weilii]
MKGKDTQGKTQLVRGVTIFVMALIVTFVWSRPNLIPDPLKQISETVKGNLNQELIQETGNTRTIPIQESANGTNQWELAVAALEKAREKNGETVVAAMENPNAKEFNSIDSFHEETIVRELNPKPIREAEYELYKSNIPILESNHKFIHSDTTANLNQEPIQEAAYELDKSNIQILELSNSESIQETANWEWAEDSYRIRLQENVNIERWAWENIQKKQNELHRGGNIRNHPPCLVANETARLLYPPSREEQRKNKDRKKQNVTRMFQQENRNRPELHQNFIIFQSPRTDRKLMHYYAIRMNGPPPTIHKQV